VGTAHQFHFLSFRFERNLLAQTVAGDKENSEAELAERLTVLP
jgi:hypothetical protein